MTLWAAVIVDYKIIMDILNIIIETSLVKSFRRVFVYKVLRKIFGANRN